MRVNVYGEELTDRIEVVTREVEGQTFYGIRFWLKFPNQPWWVHRKVNGEDDDDSSAVTLWGQKTQLLGLLAAASEPLKELTERAVSEPCPGCGHSRTDFERDEGLKAKLRLRDLGLWP